MPKGIYERKKGWHHSTETKRKMSEFHKRNPKITRKCVETMNIAKRGSHVSEESIAKMCAAKLGTSKGKANPNYKNGQTLKEYRCKDCGKKIHLHTAIYSGQGRCLSCSTKGEHNPNFKGWISREPYSKKWDNELKEKIRKRDNFQCQNCSMTEEEHLTVVSRNLLVHHIDYNKKNCKEDNLITVCLWCNTRANHNRKYWLKKYQNKIKKILEREKRWPVEYTREQKQIFLTA